MPINIDARERFGELINWEHAVPPPFVAAGVGVEVGALDNLSHNRTAERGCSSLLDRRESSLQYSQASLVGDEGAHLGDIGITVPANFLHSSSGVGSSSSDRSSDERNRGNNRTCHSGVSSRLRSRSRSQCRRDRESEQVIRRRDRASHESHGVSWCPLPSQSPSPRSLFVFFFFRDQTQCFSILNPLFLSHCLF